MSLFIHNNLPEPLYYLLERVLQQEMVVLLPIVLLKLLAQCIHLLFANPKYIHNMLTVKLALHLLMQFQLFSLLQQQLLEYLLLFQLGKNILREILKVVGFLPDWMLLWGGCAPVPYQFYQFALVTAIPIDEILEIEESSAGQVFAQLVLGSEPFNIALRVQPCELQDVLRLVQRQMLDFDSWGGELTNKKASLLERYIGMVDDVSQDSSEPTVRLVKLNHLILLGILSEFEVNLVSLVFTVYDVVGQFLPILFGTNEFGNVEHILKHRMQHNKVHIPVRLFLRHRRVYLQPGELLPKYLLKLLSSCSKLS